MWSYRLEGPLSLVRHDIAKPDPDGLAEGQVLLHFVAGGICGSDIPRCRDGVPGAEPQPWGFSLHEIVGDVVASRSDIAVGSRVVGWVVGCFGLSEYVLTNAEELMVIDPGADPVETIPLQPLACVVYAVQTLGDLGGRRAAVIGLGSIGLLFAHALKSAGAAHVTGVDPVDRSDVAGAFGLDEVVPHTSRHWAGGLAGPDRYDLVIEAVGHQVGTLEDAVVAAAPGGTVVAFGNPDETYYPLNFGAMMDNNLTLRAGRTPASSRRHALELARDYAERNPGFLARYVSDVRRVAEAPEAYLIAARPKQGQLKIVLDGR
jgi:threonine dehydrogenase-like Zn-dependent dehydrogenase